MFLNGLKQALTVQKKHIFVAKNIATKNIAMIKTNPFKFGSVVDEPYFTNRVTELQQIKIRLLI